MITFDSENRIIYLENERITYAFAVPEGRSPEHLFFGPRCGHDLRTGTYSQQGLAHQIMRKDASGFAYNPTRVPQEIHTAFGGDYGEPTLLLSDADGSRRTDLTFSSFRILPQKPVLPGLPSLRGGETLEVTLTGRNVAVILLYTLYDDCDVLARSLRIRNTGEKPLSVRKAFSFAFSLPVGSYRAVSLWGAARNEGQLQSVPLSAFGLFGVDSRRGFSSAIHNPFLALAESSATEEHGAVWGANLVWSGSFALHAERMTTGLIRFQGGFDAEDFSWKLEPGESFQTPEAVLAFSEEGLSGLSRAFHKAYLDHLMDPARARKSRPVVFNNWEGTRFDFTGDALREMVRLTEGLGLDLFVLDDGWFGKRNDSFAGLGDWVPNEAKLGGPLAGLAACVREKGMRFGLWFEPEMVNADSDLFRAHPDWVLRTPHDIPAECRNQMVLDLTRPEVRDYLAGAVNRVLDSCPIDYVKWDCNRDLTEGYSLSLPPDRQQEVFFRQILGLYDLLDRIVKTHPDIFFEGCSSGGSRTDPGMLAYFPQIWLSDQSDCAARALIQYGISLFCPLPAHSCHVTASPNRSAAHLTPIASRAAVAELGAAGFEFDPRRLPPEELAAVPDLIRRFRADEDFVLHGELHRLLNPFEGNWFAEELVLPDKSAAKIVALKFQENMNRPDPRICPRGLDPDVRYRTEVFASVPGKAVPEKTGECTMSGRSLMHFGLRPDFSAGDFQSLIFTLRAENDAL